MLKDLMNKTYAGRILAGKHSATISSFGLVEDPKNMGNDYVRMTMKIDGNRDFTRNLFERDFTMFLSHTRRQLGRECEDIIPAKYIQELIKNNTKLNIWFSYPVVNTRNGAREVTNINWLPPMESTTPADNNNKPIEHVDDEEAPF